MAGFSILAKLGLDSSKFASSLKSQNTAMSKFGAAIGTAVKAGAAIAATAFAAFTVKGIKDMVEFEKKMTEVFTLLPGISKEAMEEMSADTRKLATSMGVDLMDATQGLYQAISAGVPKENVFDFMEIASKASIGGVTSLETAVDGITTAINTYGASNLSAKDAADSMFTAVKLGKTTFEELSGALFNVLPIAKQAGVSFDEITAALAVMTSKGTPTSVATTQLRAALTALIAPTAKTAKAFQEYGLDVGNLKALMAGGEGGLVKAMQNVMVATNGDETAIRKLLGSTEAMNAVFTLTSGNAKSFGDAMVEMMNKTGANDAAFKAMSKTVAHQLNLMLGNIKDLGMQFGAAFLPLINQLLPKAITFFKNLVPNVKDLAVNFADLVMEIAASVATLGKFVALIIVYSAAAKVAKVAMAALSIAVALFTTRTTAATAATARFNAVSKANIFALVATAAIAAGFAVKGFIDEVGKVKSLEGAKKWLKDINDEIDANKEGAAAAEKRIKALYDELEQFAEADFANEQLHKGISLLETQLDLRQKDLKLAKDGQGALKATIAQLDKNIAKEKERHQRALDIHKEGGGRRVEELDHERKMGDLQADRDRMEEDLLTKKVAVKQLTQDILDIEKDRKKEIEDAKQVQLDTKKIIDDVYKVKMLEKTEVGKIHLLELGIRDLEIQKKNLIDNSLVSRNLETGAAKDLETVEGNILAKREAIEGIIKGALKDAQDAELLRIKDLVTELGLALQAEKDRAKEAGDAADAKEAEVAAFRKDLEAAEAALEPLKKFFQKDFKGQITPNYAEMRREFKKLKEEGKLPPNTETLADFKQMLTDQAVAAKAHRDGILEDGRIAKADADALRQEEKEALMLAQLIQIEIRDEKKRILDLEKEASEKEKKTLDQLTKEREAWQKALKDWEDKLNLIPPAEKNLTNALNNHSGSLASIDAGVAALLGKDAGEDEEGSSGGSGDEVSVDIPDPAGEDGDEDVSIPTPEADSSDSALALETTQEEILDALQGFFVNQ